MLKRRSVLIGSGGTLLASMLGAHARATRQAGGTLRYGTNSEVAGLDPHVYVGSAGKVVSLALYNGLVSFDQDANIIPSLASEWSVSDGRAYTFRLRPGVKFHGGQPFGASDVQYSFERILAPATGATLRSNLAGLKVTVIDDLTVRLEKPDVDAALLSALAMPEAAIVSAQWMSTSPNVKVEANGTGPFRLVAHEPRVRIVVERNDSYFENGLPHLEKVIFTAIPNSDARVNALRTDAVDMIEFVPWKDITNLQREPELEIQSAVGSFMNLWFNVRREPFDDPRVRQAVAFAIDRDALVKLAFFGHAKSLYGPPTEPASPYYNADLANYYSYDPARARKLLAEAGHANGFNFELMCLSGLDIFPATAQLAQANLQAIGVNARIRLVEFANMIDAKNKGQYDAMVYGVSVKLPDPDTYAYYFGADSTYWAKPSGFNDAQVEKLLIAGRSHLDVGARKKVYHQLQKRILELSPWAFLVWRDQAQAYRKGIAGFAQLPGALNESGPGIALRTMRLDT